MQKCPKSKKKLIVVYTQRTDTQCIHSN